MVFNVGQGDSLLINPQGSCQFSKKPLLIDTGPLKAKVITKIRHDKLSVLLTHSHYDHIGGLSDFINENKIDKLYISLYFPEVISGRFYL